MPVDWTKTAAEIERDFHEIESQLAAAQERVKKAERDSLNYGIALENAKQELTAAESRADQDRADAERIDWLETQNCWIGLKETMCGIEPVIAAGRDYMDSVRAAIDAARATQKGSEEVK